MLLWEALRVATERPSDAPTSRGSPEAHVLRLPYDKRCSALTKAGTRCRGRIRPGGDVCAFHDPHLALKRKEALAASPRRKHRRLSHIPDGYLRKLSNATAVGEAMDRLYREVGLGLVTAEMGQVLFTILTRMLDSGLVSVGPRLDRTKAARIRPKLNELLTRQELAAWRKAVDNATTLSRSPTREPAVAKSPRASNPPSATDKPAKLRLQAAS